MNKFDAGGVLARDHHRRGGLRFDHVRRASTELAPWPSRCQCTMVTRFFGGLLVVLGLSMVLQGHAGAQATPAPAPTPIVVPTLPPTDATTQAIIRAASGVLNDVITRNRLNAANTTRGTVSYFRRFDMQVQTGTNSYRAVRLHQGTIINPRGATPGTGTTVDVSGRVAPDGSLDADTITVLR